MMRSLLLMGLLSLTACQSNPDKSSSTLPIAVARTTTLQWDPVTEAIDDSAIDEEVTYLIRCRTDDQEVTASTEDSTASLQLSAGNWTIAVSAATPSGGEGRAAEVTYVVE